MRPKVVSDVDTVPSAALDTDNDNRDRTLAFFEGSSDRSKHSS